MGQRCPTLDAGYTIQEPFESDEFDVAGSCGGDFDFDEGDREGGGAGEFEGFSGLGGDWDECSVAQPSSSGPWNLAVDGGATPGRVGVRFRPDWGPIAYGRAEQDRAGGIPFRRQPAPLVEEYSNDPRDYDTPTDWWARGSSHVSAGISTPPRANSKVAPVPGRAGDADEELRPKKVQSIAAAVGDGCQRSSPKRDRPTPRDVATGRDARNPSEGATSHRKNAPDDATSLRATREGRRELQRESQGPRVPVYTAPTSYNARRALPHPTDVRGRAGTYQGGGNGRIPLQDLQDQDPYWQGHPYELSPRIPMHIDAKTAYSALSGEFVQLERFLDCDINEYHEVDNFNDSLLRPLRPRRLITSLYKWMEAWGHYEVTLVSRYGLELYFELASYRSFIISLTEKYKIPFILTYDERHRAALGRARSFDFSYFNNQLFVTIFDVNALRATTKCQKCASVEHNSKDCPFRGSAPSGGAASYSGSDKQKSGRQSIDPNEVCIRFQDGTCRFRKCPRKHCCFICGGPNGAKSCQKCTGKSGPAPST